MLETIALRVVSEWQRFDGERRRAERQHAGNGHDGKRVSEATKPVFPLSLRGE
ncbi:MAG: hypothetical protein ACREPK_07215 [Rhodanobacteraceae bacterium]